MKKFFISIFIFSIIVQQVLAYGKEFKNMLVDLEIGRAGEDTYKVNLKTEVPYPDEIKIVKKSDYNYYILLAETYSLIKTTKSSGTIKSIKVDTYPYAEQNFENGFTKVTFNTTRPVEFIVSLSAKRASKFPVMDLVRLARLDNLYKENNFDYLNPKYKVAEVALPEKTAQKEAVVAKKEISASQKVAQVPQKVAQATEAPTVTQAKKEVVKQVQKEISKVAPAQKPQIALKVPQAPKVDVKKQEQPQKTATAQRIASAQKTVTALKATVKPAEAPKVTASQKQTQPQAVKATAKQVAEKKQAEKAAPQAPKADNSVGAPKTNVQTKVQEKSAPKASVKPSEAPAETPQFDIQSPKEMPKVPEIAEDKVPDNIELEPIEKIDEEPVPNDFKNRILSFLIGNKISILAGLILLFAISALSQSKKKSSKNLVPVAAPAVEEVQTKENFENVLNEEAKAEIVKTQKTQEAAQNIEEQHEEVAEEEIASLAQEETEILEEVAQEEIVPDETAENNEISGEQTEEIKEEEPEVVASVPIEESATEELPAEKTPEEPPVEIVETQEEAKSPEEIEEEIQQEIRQEIENESTEILDEIDETEEDILEVAEIKEEIESAIGGTYDPAEEVIEIQKEENISVHNLDIINRQAPSGNYEDEDLIELDDIKNEIAEIKNNLSAKEVEPQVEIIEPEQEEKVETAQTVAQVEIIKPQPKEAPKLAPELKQTQGLKQAPSLNSKQMPEKPVQKITPAPKSAPQKKAPVKKAPVARILCKTQIENDRGLYLADYAGNKALVGYVNNNVFVLYNFKNAKIRNNEIIFRLSEAKPKEDLYYVMVDNKKFLIKSEQYRLSLMQKIS